MDMEDFLPKLRKPEVTSIKLQKEHKLIKKFTKDLWRFSYEFDTRTFEKKRRKREKETNLKNGKKCTNNAFLNLSKYQLNHESGATSDYKKKSCEIFITWRDSFRAFLRYFQNILERSQEDPEPPQGESRFTELFRLFSKTCLLHSEPGHAYREELNIKDQTVRGFPDARFIAYPFPKVVAVTEVKKETEYRIRGKHDKSSVLPHVPDNVLGQHGVELLMDKKRSFFDSGVAGFICLGTKVIFTFLEITDDQYEDITNNGEDCSNKDLKIYYTKHFDFMKTADRNEMMEPLLKLAFCVEKNVTMSSNA